MKEKVFVVPSVTTQEKLAACLSQKITAFAVEEPIYTLILTYLGGESFLPDYLLEDYPDHKTFIAKRNRSPHRFQSKHMRLVYAPFGWT